MKLLDISICRDIAKVITNDDAKFCIENNQVFVFDEYLGTTFISIFHGNGLIIIFDASDPKNWSHGTPVIYDIKQCNCCDPSIGYREKLKELLSKKE